MKVITKISLALTEEEKITLNTAATLLGRIARADNSYNQNLADFLLGYCEIGSFDELSDLLYKITDSAENE